MGKQWNKIFKERGKVFEKIQEDIPRIARIFKKHNVKTILNLGCGTGRHTVYLTKQGFDVYGFDNSSEGIKIAKNWLKEDKLKADFKISSIYKKLPYKDSFFDAIVSTSVIHHGKIQAIKKLIKEKES